MALFHVGPVKRETSSVWGSAFLKEISPTGHTYFEYQDSPGWGDVLGPPQPPRPWGWPWDVRCSWWRGVGCPIWKAWCRQAPTAAWSSGDRKPCSRHACERVPARSLRSSAAASHGCISHLHRHRGQGSIRPHGVHSLHHVFGEAYPAGHKHDCNASSPATGHFDTGFSWFPRVYKRMLRWFPSFQVATTCLSCSPLELNFLVTFFFFPYLFTCNITTATGW